MKISNALLALSLALGVSLPAQAELIVSSNDGHQPPEPDEKPWRVPDTVSVIDFTNGTARVLGTVEAPGSIIGPPMAVAIAQSERWAVVSAGTRGDPSDLSKTLPDGVISVIDISTPSRPRVSQTLQVGEGVSGVTINRAGTLVLTANTNEGTVSVFAAANGVLTSAGKIQLGEGVRPSSVTFLHDGRSAIVNAGGVYRLAVNGNTVTLAGKLADIGGSISAMMPDGLHAVVNGGPLAPPPPGGAPVGRSGRGGAPNPGPVTLIDLTTGAVVASGVMGGGAEYIGLSPDGTLLAATNTNGSHSARDAPGFNDFGLLKIFRVSTSGISQIAEAQTGHWCQGSIFSRDNRTILLQCGVEKQIEVYRFDGKSTLTRDGAATLKFDGRPSAMASASSR